MTLRLFEQYNIGGQKVTNTLGSLTASIHHGYKFHLAPNVPSFLTRRLNFQGQHLKAVVEDQYPYIMFKQYPVPDKQDESDELYNIDRFNAVHGLFHDILKALGSQMNFTWSLYRRHDTVWGTHDPVTNQTNGIVKSVVEGRVDMAAAPLTITGERSTVLNYLIPMGKETYTVFIRNPDQQAVSWTLFVDPFKRELWIFLICAAFVLALAIKLVETGYEWKSRRWCSLGQPQTVLFNAWVVFKVTCFVFIPSRKLFTKRILLTDFVSGVFRWASQ